MADFELQRKNMVESQVRPSDVTDRRILRAMQSVPREAFAPAALRALAYMDEALPLGTASAGRPLRTMMSARVLAKLIQALDLGERDLVLEVGTGTGYGAAVLSKIAQTVVALESDDALAAEAQRNLSKLGFDTVAVLSGPLPAGWAAEGPYDAILIDGAVASVPPALLDQLKDGGRLAAITLERGVGKAMLWRRVGGTFDSRAIFDASAPLLPGFEPKREFVF